MTRTRGSYQLANGHLHAFVAAGWFHLALDRAAWSRRWSYSVSCGRISFEVRL